MTAFVCLMTLFECLLYAAMSYDASNTRDPLIAATSISLNPFDSQLDEESNNGVLCLSLKYLILYFSDLHCFSANAARAVSI